MKNIFDLRIENDLRIAGRGSWNTRRRKKSDFDIVNSPEDRNFIFYLSKVAGSKKSPSNILLVESFVGLTKKVYYTVAELKKEMGYVVVSEPLCDEINCFYSKDIEGQGFLEVLIAISQCPAAPNTRNLQHSKAYRLEFSQK